MASGRIKAIDQTSVHRITSSQVVVDLQTAIKELVENALDAGATVIEVRVKDNGVKSIEVIDNGSGISKDDYDTVALKHHTSKLSTFEDLTTVETFGFRGEALASLCALCESVTITTATSAEAPMGTILELDRSGRVTNKDRKVARQRGTTVAITGLFTPLPVRRKEFERHAKREYGKALTLLTAYALIPCTAEGGVKLTVSHISESGKKSVQIQTDGSTLLKNSITALWGSKAMDSIIPLSLDINVEPDSAAVKRRGLAERQMTVKMTGLVSKFAVGCGRSSNDRQFFYVNKRPCTLPKVQKAFNEIYKTFNATQSPFIVVDFTLPTDACDINVSPDKRTIFLHSEHNLIEAMKAALLEHFDDSRSTFTLQPTGGSAPPDKSATQQLKRRATAPESARAVSPPEEEDTIPAPSSDPLPVTQPVPILIPSSDSVDNPPSAPPADDDEPTNQVTNSSILADNMSPSPPPSKPDGFYEERALRAAAPRKRPASRSPSGSPARPLEVASRPKKPVQMVLNTSGASWALAKGNDATSSNYASKYSGGFYTATTVPIRKPSSSIMKTLTQYRRESGQGKESNEVEDVVEEASESGDDDGEPDISAKADKPVEKIKGRASSRSSRSSMRIDSPPGSPESVPETDQVAREPEEKRTSKSRIPPTKPTKEQAPPVPPENEEVVDLTTVDPNAEEITKEDEAVIMPMSFNLDTVTTLWNEAPKAVRAQREAASWIPGPAKSLSNTVDVDQNQEGNAEELLSRVIQKDDFERMEILGQFNLGFIIVRSRRAPDIDAMDVDGEEDGIDDLFIVDQHAADEKYNFETLQATTRIESQKLLRARPLDFSASDKLVALENIEVLQSNGFEVELEEDEAEGTGSKLLLVSQPVSKSTVFDMNDLSELLHLMQDKPAGTMVRCSKARAMFASRACRKSVMVGHPLTRAQMTSVVRHMSTMDQPWNCPHGRPTMRHLMRMSNRKAERFTKRSRQVDWEKLMES
ncbi:hypothetical protein M408DRAFT_331017 [Serendipita vermifera MAFF 305830]|uniref:DNA mismatch repair protein PMS1 n=1 Tax=Serendipita vermifera MAFF 305830 TaxID=933852 RepID=A0A0C3B2B7_SERVB|nr:hypothetical protein M408DRAFT_331017 [Serendipita vermifera MAFF 305830]